ncbi:terminase small subunit, partial [Enterococcus faecalis]|uniref:terminase small subunit n=3 Tax=Enterococcus TaxID=1350 RepID=UPI003B671592
DEQLEKMQNERVADAQEVLEYLTSTMRGEKMKGVYNTETTNDEGEIFTHQKSYEYTPSTEERTKAAELLGKRHALFTDKQEISATVRTDKLDSILQQLGDEDD